MALDFFRVLRWLILGGFLTVITVIHFTRYYDHMYQEKSATLELVNSRDRNIRSGTVRFTNKSDRGTSLQEQNKYIPPKICGKKWQSRYQALHEDIVNNRRDPKFLVYSCPWTNNGCCGYGNRVYAMVSLFYLAILTDRAFLIDWKVPKPLEHFLKPMSIDWNFPIPYQMETRKHYWRTGGEKNKVRGGWLAKNTSSFISWISSENVVDYFDKPVEIATSILFFAQNGIKKNKYLMKRARKLKVRPLLRRATRYAMIGCAYDFLFRPTKSLQDALENTRKALRENGNSVIGIHIRIGDLQFGRNNTRVSDFHKFFSCAKKVEREIFSVIDNTTKRQIRWFVATDSAFVKNYARIQFSNKIVTDNNKPEHLDIYKKGEKPSEKGMMGVLHDHYILAESDFLVLSESSFSITAVGLGMRRSNTYTFGDKCNLKLKKPL